MPVRVYSSASGVDESGHQEITNIYRYPGGVFEASARVVNYRGGYDRPRFLGLTRGEAAELISKREGCGVDEAVEMLDSEGDVDECLPDTSD